MAFNVTKTPSGSGDYAPIPEDQYGAYCIGVLDLGTHTDQYPGSEPRKVRKIKLQFEIPDLRRDDGKTATISRQFNYSTHEKSRFREALDGWLGVDWPDRYEGRSWDFLLGMTALLNVHHKKSTEGKTYAAIRGLSRCPRKMEPEHAPERDHFFLDLDEKRLPSVLSKWDAEMIRRSEEYLAGGFIDEAPRDELASTGYQRPAYTNNLPTERPTPVGANVDVPF